MVNQPKWNIEHSRVYGDGKSFNCTNKITAEQLYNTLTTYENNIKLQENTTQQFHKINTQIIQIRLSIGILQEEITTLKENLECISK